MSAASDLYAFASYYELQARIGALNEATHTLPREDWLRYLEAKARLYVRVGDAAQALED